MLKIKNLFFLILIVFLVFVLNSINANAKTRYIHVEIKGFIRKPGIYKLKYGSRLSDLLEEIWPPEAKAYLKNAFLFRKQLKIDRKVELIGLRREIEHLKGLNRYVRQKIARQFLKLKPSGRVIIHLKNPVLLLNTKDNLRLKNNDIVLIKGRPKYVFVEGAVKNPGKFYFKKNQTYKYYLDESHGTRSDAVSGFLYIIKATGKIEKISRNFIVWNKAKNRWEFAIFERPKKINPGDIIFVPFDYGRITSKLTRLILAVYKRTGTLLKYSPN
ncbi:MAG: SLBB domain-containing protein [Candidatus Acidulodesulfobacterium sp.]